MIQAETTVNYVDTFKAPEPGYIGGFFNNKLFYYSSPSTPTCAFNSRSPCLPLLSGHARKLINPVKKTFDISNINSLPRVDIVYGHQEFDGRILDAITSFGDVKGIVIASPNGGVGADAAISRAAGKMPVVRHVRINVGAIAPSVRAPAPGVNATISSGLVNNQKSRIQLQLALATGADPRESFEEPFRTILYG